jgi:hypothetical protein
MNQIKKWWNEKSDIDKSISLLIYATTVTVINIILIVISTIRIFG